MSSSANEIESTRQRVESCEALVEEAANSRISPGEFTQRLRESGVSTIEAKDYIEQFEQRVRQLNSRSSANPPLHDHSSTLPLRNPSREITPEGLTSDEVDSFRLRRGQILAGSYRGSCNERTAREIADETAWGLLRTRANCQQSENLRSTGRQFSAEEVAQLLGRSSDSFTSSVIPSIPASVLAVAPHLNSLSSNLAEDSHLQETWKLRQVFSFEKAIDPILNIVQVQPLTDPLPRSIWRNIIQDQYVDFEKLYASMDLSYSHQDDARDFGGGYSIVKKDLLSAKKSVRGEAEWIRIFEAWKSGVILLYPHRASELGSYRQMVVDLFRAAPLQPSVAISFDVEARSRYSRNPFHMDDRNRLQIPLLTQMFRPSSAKRDPQSDFFMPTAKRPAIPCQNWSLGFCNDPCINNRKHGICCECGGKHKAQDREACLVDLQARRRKGSSQSGSEIGGSSSTRS